MADDGYLHLDSESLFSKFGFGGGGTPDGLLDHCQIHEIPYPTHQEWSSLLRDFVRVYLLPILPVRVDTFTIETFHNPIRAQSVNGADVDWTTPETAERSHTFPRVAIQLPYDQVAYELTMRRRLAEAAEAVHGG